MQAAALLAAGATGQSLFTATTPQEAREEIAAAHDVTTRHGELVVRVDAGGADVTALAPIDPGTTGQVLTVSDSGVPVARDPRRRDPRGDRRGRGLRGRRRDRGRRWRGGRVRDDAAQRRAAVGRRGRRRQLPVTLLTGHEADWTSAGATPAGSTATITGGQVTVTQAASTSCDIVSGACATDAVRAYRTLGAITLAEWSLRARIVSVDAYGLWQPALGVVVGTTWATTAAKYGLYFVSNADTLTFYRWGASGSSAGAAVITNLRAGQGWVRIDGLGRTLTAYGGTGTGGAEPTSWTPIGTFTLTTAEPQPQQVVAFSTGSTGEPARGVGQRPAPGGGVMLSVSPVVLTPARLRARARVRDPRGRCLMGRLPHAA